MRGLVLAMLLACTDGSDSLPGESHEGPAENSSDGVPLEFGSHPQSIGQAYQVDTEALSQKPDIVVVVIDTLRADHLSLYGHDRETTPNIDSLGRDGLWFSRAYSQSGWTLPSFSSLFSGLLPHQHRVGRDRKNVHLFGRLGDEVLTLAELLSDGGYRTAAVMNNTFLAPEFGLNQGFDLYDWQGASNVDIRSAEETVGRGLAWLEQSDQPAFLVLHFMEPHANYAPREALRHRFTPPGEPPIPVPFTFEDGQRPEPYSGAELDYLLRLYDEEIADADLGIGKLVEGLAASGRFENSVLVLTADHGEEFWEHGQFEHGKNLHGELTRVPLVLHGPGLIGGEVDVVVEHLDLFETLLEIGGMESPVPAGESLLGLLQMMDQPSYGALLASRTAVSDNTLYGPPRVSIADFGHRFNLDQAMGRAEVWQVDEDGMEREQLGGEALQIEFERLKLRLEGRRGNLDAIAVDAQSGFLMENHEVFDQLRLLGYLED